MSVNAQVQAVLLMTAYLGKPAKDDPKPLTPTEWGRLALWLKERQIVPEALLEQDTADVLTGWMDRTITPGRVRYLLGRAGALALEMERWERAGLWILPRSDPRYPVRMKKRLQMDSPPAFYGCGDCRILSRRGIAVVGSRGASAEDIAFASRLAGQAASEGLSIVSGGARGVDEAAILGALEAGGVAVGVLSDSLLRAATSTKYRKALMAGKLVLISPFNPEAGFDVGNAMARNKYVYCLADAAVVVASERNKGGTWNGATENLRKRWVPLWVKRTRDSASGNDALVQLGGRWIPDAGLEPLSLFRSPSTQNATGERDERSKVASGVALPKSSPSLPVSSVSDVVEEYQVEAGAEDRLLIDTARPDDVDLYFPFLIRLKILTSSTPVTAEQLMDSLKITRAQLKHWLGRAEHEGRIRKWRRPVRYAWDAGKTRQPQLFDPSE